MVTRTLLVFVVLSSSFAAINSKLVFDDITCVIENKDYIESVSCSVDKSGKIPLLNSEIQMKKEVQDSRYDFAVYAISGNNIPPVTLFKTDSLDHCDMQTKENLVPIIKMVHEAIKKAGSLPKGCPIAADFHYSFKNVSINNDMVPSYLRNAGFKIVLVHYNKKTRLLTVTITGKLV